MSRYCPLGMGLSRAYKRSAIRGSGRLVVSYPTPILSYLTWVSVIVISFPGRSSTRPATSEMPLALFRPDCKRRLRHRTAVRDQRYWSECLVLLLRGGRHEASDGSCIVALP